MFKEFNVQFQDAQIVGGADNLLENTKVTKVVLRGDNNLSSLDSTFKNCSELDIIEGAINLDGVSDIDNLLDETPLVKEVTLENINTEISAKDSFNDVNTINIDGNCTKEGIQSFLSNFEWNSRKHKYVGEMENTAQVLTEELNGYEDREIIIDNSTEYSAKGVEIYGQTYQNLVDGKNENIVKNEWTLNVNDGSGSKDLVMDNTADLDEIQGQTYQNLISNASEEKNLVDPFEFTATSNSDGFNGGFDVFVNEIQGNTVQDTIDYSISNVGELFNLFDVNKLSSGIGDLSVNGNEVTVSRNHVNAGLNIVDGMNIKPSTSYTFKAKIKDVSSGVDSIIVEHYNNGSAFDDNKTFSVSDSISFKFTTPSKLNNLRISVLITAPSFQDLYVTFYDIILVEGNYEGDYVPYGSYKVEVMCKSRNLWDGKTWSRGRMSSGKLEFGYTTNEGLAEPYGLTWTLTGSSMRGVTIEFIPISGKKDIIYSFNYSSIDSRANSYTWFNFFTEEKVYIKTIHSTDSIINNRVVCKATNVPSNARYVSVCYQMGSDGGGPTYTMTNIMLTEGDDNPAFEEQYTNKTTFILPQPLKRWAIKYGHSTFIKQDRVYWDSNKGKYMLERLKTKKIIIDSSNIDNFAVEFWTNESSINGDIYTKFGIYNGWDSSKNPFGMVDNLSKPSDNTNPVLGVAEGYAISSNRFRDINGEPIKSNRIAVFNYEVTRTSRWGLGLYIKDKLISDDIDGVKDYILKNPIELEYIYDNVNEYETIELEDVSKQFLTTYDTSYICVSNGTVNSKFIKVATDMFKKEALVLPSTKYSLMMECDRNSAENGIAYDLCGATGTIKSTDGYKYMITPITTPSTLSHNTLKLGGLGNKVKNVMLLKDTMSNQIGYFEGIQSFGELQDDGKYKVEVNIKSANLFNYIDEYKRNTKTFYLDEPLRKIDNISDRLYYDYDKGKYCVERNIGILDKSKLINNGMSQTSDSNYTCRYYMSNAYGDLFNNTGGLVRADGFHPNEKWDHLLVNQAIGIMGGSLMITLKNSDIDAYGSFGECVRNKPFNIYMVYLNPIIEELEDTNQSINVYTPTTYISTNSVIKPSTLKIESKPITFNVNLVPNAEYTLQFDVDRVTTDNKLTYYLGGTTGNITTENGYNTRRLVLNTPNTIEDNILKFVGEGHTIKNVMLLKDGQVQELNYFDGVLNLGELQEDGKYKIELKSYNKEDEIYESENIIIEDTKGEEVFEIEEIQGNTWQNHEDLSEIVSVGELQEDGNYKVNVITTGINLIGKIPKPKNGHKIYSRFIPIKPSTTYRFGFLFDGTITNGISVYYYDENMKYIKEEYGTTNGNFHDTTSPSNAYYARTSLNSGYYSFDETKIKFVFTEDLTVDSFIEALTNEISFTLPQPLRRFYSIYGSKPIEYSDKLYWDENKGHYCIEKNIDEFNTGNISYTGSLNIPFPFPDNIKSSLGSYSDYPFIISGVKTSKWDGSHLEVFAVKRYSSDNYIRLATSLELTNEQVSEKLSNKSCIYVMTSPEIIDLPHLNQKIKVKAQANKTYIQTGNVSSTSVRAAIRYGRTLTFNLDEQLYKVDDVCDKLYWDETKGHFCIDKKISPNLQVLSTPKTIDLVKKNEPIELYPKEITKISCNNKVKPSKIKIKYIDIQ